MIIARENFEYNGTDIVEDAKRAFKSHRDSLDSNEEPMYTSCSARDPFDSFGHGIQSYF